jgi:hypothetical protein
MFADLIGADLSFTILVAATLSYANLLGANLQLCRMDVATELNGIRLDTHIKLGDVNWNGVPLTLVDWRQAPRLGDEDEIAKYKMRDDRIEVIRMAARAYRGLATALRSQSMTRESSGYRLREQRLEQRVAQMERHYGSWLLSSVLGLVSGYGERPGRIFVAYLVVVLGFAGLYLGIGHASGLIPGPVDAIVFSLTSFHGRGFFPNENIGLHHPLTICAALEAVCGLFIELILIATFSRRFLGS